MHTFRPSRLPLLFLAIASLLAALGGGLARLGWVFAPLPPLAVTHHGVILVAGFLGTLISLERAVGAKHKWSYGAPILTGLGAAVGLLSGSIQLALPILFAGAAVFTASQIYHAHLFPSAPTRSFALGALCLAIGCAVALRNYDATVLWWVSYLTLTIVAERLELSKILAPPQHAKVLFLFLVFFLLAGTLLVTGGIAAGGRIVGASLLALALWLARWDLARRSIYRPGLARFIGITLLTGFFWLGVSGLLFLLAPSPRGSLLHDATLHSFFLGFVFGMIFAHAPIIFPAVLGLSIVFRRRFYVHLALLHLGVIGRVGSDLFQSYTGQRWSVILNALAILLFLAQTISTLGKSEDAPDALAPSPKEP